MRFKTLAVTTAAISSVALAAEREYIGNLSVLGYKHIYQNLDNLNGLPLRRSNTNQTILGLWPLDTEPNNHTLVTFEVERQPYGHAKIFETGTNNSLVYVAKSDEHGVPLAKDPYRPENPGPEGFILAEVDEDRYKHPPGWNVDNFYFSTQGFPYRDDANFPNISALRIHQVCITKNNITLPIHPSQAGWNGVNHLDCIHWEGGDDRCDVVLAQHSDQVTKSKNNFEFWLSPEIFIETGRGQIEEDETPAERDYREDSLRYTPLMPWGPLPEKKSNVTSVGVADASSTVVPEVTSTVVSEVAPTTVSDVAPTQVSDVAPTTTTLRSPFELGPLSPFKIKNYSPPPPAPNDYNPSSPWAPLRPGEKKVDPVDNSDSDDE